MEEAFTLAKAALSQATTLTHTDPTAPVSLAVDASNSHVGAVLQQLERNSWRPLAFFRRKLSGPETRNSTFDRELLAVYASLRHFHFFLEGRSFFSFTDHKPLYSALHRVSPPWSARQQRHLSYVAEFTSDICYLPEPENPVADALSRPSNDFLALSLPPLCPLLSLLQMAPGIDFRVMADLQKSCTDVLLLSSDPKFCVLPFPLNGSPSPLLCKNQLQERQALSSVFL